MYQLLILIFYKLPLVFQQYFKYYFNSCILYCLYICINYSKMNHVLFFVIQNTKVLWIAILMQIVWRCWVIIWPTKCMLSQTLLYGHQTECHHLQLTQYITVVMGGLCLIDSECPCHTPKTNLVSFHLRKLDGQRILLIPYVESWRKFKSFECPMLNLQGN